MLTIKFKEGTYVPSNLRLVLSAFNSYYHSKGMACPIDDDRRQEERHLLKIIIRLASEQERSIDYVIFKGKFLLFSDFANTKF